MTTEPEAKPRDWAAHNKALIGRGSLTVRIDQDALDSWDAEHDPDKRGRPFVYADAAVVNGDGKAEVVTGAGGGGGPNVKIFSPAGDVLSSFFAYIATPDETPPVDVELLGLKITTSDIRARLLARTGEGQILGNLVYNVAHLLDPGGSLNLLTILGRLGL